MTPGSEIFTPQVTFLLAFVVVLQRFPGKRVYFIEHTDIYIGDVVSKGLYEVNLHCLLFVSLLLPYK